MRFGENYKCSLLIIRPSLLMIIFKQYYEFKNVTKMAKLFSIFEKVFHGSYFSNFSQIINYKEAFPTKSINVRNMRKLVQFTFLLTCHSDTILRFYWILGDHTLLLKRPYDLPE